MKFGNPNKKTIVLLSNCQCFLALPLCHQCSLSTKYLTVNASKISPALDQIQTAAQFLWLELALPTEHTVSKTVVGMLHQNRQD